MSPVLVTRFRGLFGALASARHAPFTSGEVSSHGVYLHGLRNASLRIRFTVRWHDVRSFRALWSCLLMAHPRSSSGAVQHGPMAS